MWFHLSLRSDNKKTGPIPVSTSSSDTCPPSCPLRGGKGCYAESGPISWFWRRVKRTDLGVSWNRFLSQVRSLPEGQLWRHNQAGDLPAVGEDIDREMLRDVIDTNRGRRGFTFTHKPLT